MAAVAFGSERGLLVALRGGVLHRRHMNTNGCERAGRRDDRRWLPYLRHMRVLIDRGRVGQLYHCSLHYIGDYGRNGQYNWRFDRGRANGILGDLGSHMIDLARWLVGDIVRVSAHLATHASRVDPDGALLDSANDAAHLLVEFASGAHGMIEVSAVGVVGARFMEQRMALHGASGSLNATIAFGGDSRLDGVGNDGSPPADVTIPDELWATVDARRGRIRRSARPSFASSRSARGCSSTIS